MNNNDFCIFILTHGRPSNQKTLKTLERLGYTGKIYLVIDDEDSTEDQYRKLYKEKVIQFNKSIYDSKFDTGDNFNDRRCIVYGRNAVFDIARDIGIKYFMVLDDDYNQFDYRFDHNKKYTQKKIKNINKAIDILLNYFISTNIDMLAIGQSGDYIGGENSSNLTAIKTKRKIMNTFICKTNNQIEIKGRMNEDVNLYTESGRRGKLFITIFQLSITQGETQKNEGGMTDIYKNVGTYVKSFYSVMYCPSGVFIKLMGAKNKRIHHNVKWDNVAPKILNEKYSK